MGNVSEFGDWRNIRHALCLSQREMATLLLVFGYFYRKDMKANAEQYRSDMKFYTDQMKAVSDEWKGQSAYLAQIIKENTIAFAHNTAVMQSLHQHISDGERRMAFRRPSDHKGIEP